MDDAARQIARPVRREVGQLGVDEGGEAGHHALGAVAGTLEQRRPGVERQRVRPRHLEVGAVGMELRERGAGGGAMRLARTAHRQALEEGDHRRRAAGEAAERAAVARLHRLRAVEAFAGEMLHQADEERQVRLGDALLVEREDERAGLGMQQEVRVLDALRDALHRVELADVVGREEALKLVVGDFGVDGHQELGPSVETGAGASGSLGVARAAAAMPASAAWPSGWMTPQDMMSFAASSGVMGSSMTSRAGR
ncbi:hypothetical protein RHAL1_02388 [Beijerinckiaceae bacterium RH AL1]|nr:hypothetical protein RHAL1_02388 [Beijerinckiaceae bacterium RH AL1]